MSIVIPNTGDAKLLAYMLNNTAADNVVLHLYSNVVTLSKTTVVGNLTELSATGYSPITLTGGSWVIATVSNVTTASYVMQSWAITVAATIEGYYVTNNGGTTLLWAEAFSPAFILPGGGGTVNLTPTITLN